MSQAQGAPVAGQKCLYPKVIMVWMVTPVPKAAMFTQNSGFPSNVLFSRRIYPGYTMAMVKIAVRKNIVLAIFAD